MERIRTVRLAIWLVLALALAFQVAWGAAPVQAMGMGPGHGGGGGGMTTLPYDASYMKSMIPHHQSAVEMGKICLQRAVHSTLKTFCQNVITVQSAEIADMQRWLLAWYGIRQPATIDRMGQMSLARISGLYGAAFEKAFLNEMIMHHQMAVHMSQPCTYKATHSELRGLCASIIKSQTAEIQQMQSWLCVWYSQCDTRRMRGGH